MYAVKTELSYKFGESIRLAYLIFHPLIEITCFAKSIGQIQRLENIWKMFLLCQEKLRKFCDWSWKFSKNLLSQGKVMEFDN